MIIRPRSYGSDAPLADNCPMPPITASRRETRMHFRLRTENVNRLLTTGLAGLLYCGAAFADDISGSDSLLCYGLSAARCEIGEACEAVAPWQLNLPDFVKLDLRGKRIQTTAGSSDQRGNAAADRAARQRCDSDSWLARRARVQLVHFRDHREGTLSVAGHGQGVTVFTVCTAVDKL